MTLALVGAVALLGPLLSLPGWLRLPVVVGELLAGIALGDSGFGIVDARDPTLVFVAQVGFGLVMFVVGSHVPVRDPMVRAGARRGVARAVAVGILAVPTGLLLAHLAGSGHGALYAVLLASSSAALVLPAVGSTALGGRTLTDLLPQVAIADAACIVALPLAIDPAHVGRALVGVAVVGVTSLVLFVVLRSAERRGLRRRMHRVSEAHDLALELRVSLVLLFGLAALATAFHVSVLLAGFGLGLAVAAIGEPRRLARQLFGLTEGFLGPLFFVWLGSSLDLRSLATHPSAIWLGLALGLAALLLHGLAALTGVPVPVAVLAGAQLGVPIAAATLGGQLGLLGPGEGSALLLGALVTVAGAALAAAALGRRFPVEP